jgi:hypothetical protein
MELEIPNPNGLPPEGPKHNQTPLDQPMPKPEIKITKPEIAAHMPSPMPLNLQAVTEVDNWVKARAPAQNSGQQEFVELSTEHRQFRFEQMDRLPVCLPHSGCFLRLFYARHHPTICCSLVRHRAESRSEIKNRASVSLLPFRHCHGFCSRLCQ